MARGKKKAQSGVRNKVVALLTSVAPERILEDLRRLPTHSVIHVLLALLCNTNEQLRSWAIMAIGKVVTNLAEEDIEAGRTIMRRLMWTLNDESGGIGWGAPEAMAEIMACHEGLAREYAHILISYLNPDGNYLEYAPLQRGVVWGIARLASTRPDLMRDAAPFLRPLSDSDDARIRKLARAALDILSR